MVDYPDSLQRLIESLTALPGIGKRGAERFALFMLYEDREAAERIASSIKDILSKIVVCSQCRNIAESDPCWICSNPKRQKELLCVVESPQDVMAIERSGVFNGLYFVLGAISSQEKLPFEELRSYVSDKGIKEIIVATSPTTMGDIVALEMKKLFEKADVKISRIARGMPEGAAVRFASPLVLRDAFKRRVDA